MSPTSASVASPTPSLPGFLAGMQARLHVAGRRVDLLGGAAFRTREEDRGGTAWRVVSAERRADGLRTVLTVASPGDGLAEIDLAVEVLEPGAEAVVESAELASLALDSGGAGLRFWRNWQDIWHDIGTRPVGGPAADGEVAADTACLAGGVCTGDGSWSLVALYEPPCAWLAEVSVEDGRLVARNRSGGSARWRQPWRSDRLRLAAGMPLVDALAVLHRADRPRRRPAEAREHCGWNTWEAYHGAVTPEAVLENAAAIAALPWLRERIRYITIDDGWQLAYGDWQPNARFPAGMADLAARLEGLGFQAGIWTAPFLVAAQAEVVREHPDWLLRDGDAPIAEAGRHVLDPTHPGVHAWMFELYHRLRGWGYRYHKTDFLREPTMYATPGRPEHRPGLRVHDPRLGIVRGMRAAMQAIRAGIGEDAFWLGCGTDIASGALLMDGSRISGDIGPYWTRVPHQARSVIHNLHQHGSLYLADPDFLLVKGPDTCRPGMLDVPADSGKPYVVDAWAGGTCHGLEQVRAWASLVILSGGLVNLSDRIAILDEAGLGVIRTVLELAGGSAARALDPASPIPRVLLRREGRRCLLGLFNWSYDQPAVVSATAAMGVPFPDREPPTDVWTGAAVPVADRALHLDLPPRSARLLTWDLSA